ncbi:hypothetical protein MOD14_12335 [Bacillus haynesii]|nr:hypothetical protein [Bacillus haynesii]MCY8354955.1 hypothetical protein [Bacillus haynesii]MCY8553889.1 hypothetical protein [Bacillus haynesii]
MLIEQKASTLQLVVKGLIRLPPVKHGFILQLNKCYKKWLTKIASFSGSSRPAAKRFSHVFLK